MIISISSTLRFALLATVALSGACTSQKTATTASGSCEIGAYYHKENAVVLFDKIRKDTPPRTGYTFVDGRRGTLGDPKSELVCQSGKLLHKNGTHFERVALKEQDTTFESDGLILAGRLITPVHIKNNVRPLTVFVHGSESTPTLGRSTYPYLLAAQGVTVFAYDKRGTGKSQGQYTQNFTLLADDAATAFNHAIQMAKGQFDRAGYFGGSQGGWVAPMAAKTTNPDFLVVGFGLVLSPIEEDAEQVFDEMRRAGHEQTTITKARQVTNATGKIVASHFTDGIEELMALKQLYASEPWLYTIEGEFTGSILRATEQDLRKGIAGDFEDSNVLWKHDPMHVLRSLDMPQLWVIAANDTAAPGDLTQNRLRTLQNEGQPITLAVFPNTDHGMIEFEQNPDGSRHYTNFTQGYFRLIADTMKQEVSHPYGRGQFSKAKAQ